ncbi:MAG: ankyrin repeat domain-containing protein [Planctomycetaceae bacterium]|jgi:ankyrin repeat protein|nr:ankyrin repeat domain-containing protein [Planctomycetaceae bacterium]
MITKQIDIFYEIKTRNWVVVRDLIVSNHELLYQRDRDDNIPLHVAIEYGADIDLIRFFVDFGIDLDIKNFFGETPLLVACRSNSGIAIIKYLVESGADLFAQTIAGPALLHSAAKASTDIRVLEYLLENNKIDINEPNHAGNTPLNFAAQNNTRIEIIDYLIAKGANVVYEKYDGLQAIHDAVSSNTNVEILRRFIEKGGNVKPIQKTNMTLLQLAANSNSNPKILQYLIDNIDKDIDAENSLGFTALSYAAKNNPNLEILKLLIDNGADVGKINKRGKRAIDFAATEEKIKILRTAMLSCGLDPDEKTQIKNQPAKSTIPSTTQTLQLRELVLLNQEVEKKFCPYSDKAQFYYEVEEHYSKILPLSLCKYDLVYAKPTLELLVSLIDFLDGTSNSASQLLLIKNDVEQMTIYGGYDDWFVCWIMLDDSMDAILNLVNESNQNASPQCVNLAGCEGEFQPENICNKKSILEIALHYAIEGCPLPKFLWE